MTSAARWSTEAGLRGGRVSGVSIAAEFSGDISCARECSLYVPFMFDPKFDPGAALFIIWRHPRTGGMETVAAGTHRAMRGAWAAIQDQYPDDGV